MTGRNISATRVMASCAVIGQAMGTAAARILAEHDLMGRTPAFPDAVCIGGRSAAG